MPRPEIIAEYRDALTDTVFTPTADAVNSDKCSLYHIDMPYVLEGCMQFIHLHLNCARGCKRQVDELDLRLKKDRQLRRLGRQHCIYRAAFFCVVTSLVAPCGLLDSICDFGAIYNCLLVYIVCFTTYPFFFTSSLHYLLT